MSYKYNDCMRTGQQKKAVVRKLRKQGLSYSEIQQHVAASKSSISLWCRDIEMTMEQKARLQSRCAQPYAQHRGAKTNQEKRAAQIQAIKTKAQAEITRVSEDGFKLAGALLYWAEGDKSRKRMVNFSNSDPAMIQFMMRWFREVCGVPEEKFRIHLHLHTGQNEAQIKYFWSEITGVPLSQFHKSFIKPEGTGHRKNRLYYGTVAVRIFDSDLFWRIQGWIEGFKDSIIMKR